MAIHMETAFVPQLLRGNAGRGAAQPPSTAHHISAVRLLVKAQARVAANPRRLTHARGAAPARP